MNEDTSIQSGQNETFLRKHKRWLSFLGALIVFATFIYQEGVRDELKDRSDALNAAQSAFVSRADTNELPVYMAYINYRIGSLAQPQQKSSTDQIAASLQSMRETVDLMLANVKRVEAARDNLKRIDEALGSDPSNAGKLSTIESGARTAREHNDVVWQHANAESSAQTHDPNNIEKVVLKANQVTKECSDLRNTDIYPLETDILQQANQQRREADERYRQSKWYGYCLFGVGWLLGLIGNLFGIEGLNTEK